jgi:single-strand DNA-binding protein
MMYTSIHIQVTGFVGSDPQVRQVGQQTVASFSVASSRKTRAGDKQTLWVRVNAWNGLAEISERFVRKGSLVQVWAEWLRPSARTAQDGTPLASLDVDVNRLVLLDRLESDEPGSGEDVPF